MAARGLLNIGIGVGKVAVGVTVTAETGGLGAFFGSYEIVQGIVGNIGGGVAQLAGAATGNIEGGQTGADAAGAITSILGLGTLAYTKGNLCRATQAAQLEGLALTAFGAGMGELPRLPDKVDLGQNAYDVITGKGCGPTPSSGTCNGNCPK